MKKLFQLKPILLTLGLIVTQIVTYGQENFNELPIPFTKIGEIKPRHAKEIEASNWSIGVETIDRHFSVYANFKEYLGPLGAKKARVQSGWARTEKEKGIYDWEWLDEVVYDMVDQGVIPWMQASYGNKIYEGGGEIHLMGGIPDSEEALKAWANYVEALVNRYKAHIDEWEVWNEPNYKVDFEKYADFLILTAEVIKRVQPESKVLALALGSGVNYEFADKVLKIVYDKGKINLIDQITHHRNIAIPEENKNEIELDKVIRKYSDRIISRQGEAGCPSTYCEKFALAKRPWNELQQAKSNIRRMMLDLGRGKESSIFTLIDLRYHIEDDPRWNVPIMNTKGLIEADDEKKAVRLKPGYFAVQNTTSIFDNTLIRDTNLKVEIEGENIYNFEYRNKKNNKSLIVYWEGGAVPRDENDYKTTNIKLSGASISKPVLLDLRTGQVYAIPKKNIVKKKGEMEITGLLLYDSPVIVADLSLLKLK